MCLGPVGLDFKKINRSLEKCSNSLHPTIMFTLKVAIILGPISRTNLNLRILDRHCKERRPVCCGELGWSVQQLERSKFPYVLVDDHWQFLARLTLSNCVTVSWGTLHYQRYSSREPMECCDSVTTHLNHFTNVRPEHFRSFFTREFHQRTWAVSTSSCACRAYKEPRGSSQVGHY